MAGRPFADVLDDALNATATRARWSTGTAEANGKTGTAGGFTLPPRDPFLFFSLRRPTGAGTAPACAAAPGRAPAPAESRRWVRTLTRVQRHALETLNALGARLSSDFSLQELRREYRRLALRLHPDRHHDRNAAERERLSYAFGEATRHYRELLAAVAQPY